MALILYLYFYHLNRVYALKKVLVKETQLKPFDVNVIRWSLYYYLELSWKLWGRLFLGYFGICEVIEVGTRLERSIKGQKRRLERDLKVL